MFALFFLSALQGAGADVLSPESQKALFYVEQGREDECGNSAEELAKKLFAEVGSHGKRKKKGENISNDEQERVRRAVAIHVALFCACSLVFYSSQARDSFDAKKWLNAVKVYFKSEKVKGDAVLFYVKAGLDYLWFPDKAARLGIVIKSEILNKAISHRSWDELDKEFEEAAKRVRESNEERRARRRTRLNKK